MNLGKDIIGTPIIAISTGRRIGRVKDAYLAPDCQSVAGVYLGTEGLFSRQAFLIPSDDVVVFGEDATLVRQDDVIQEVDAVEATESWLRRDELQGRPVDTPGGTKVGKIGDVIVDKDGRILGFSLSQVYVSGPVAANRAIAVHAVQDVGETDGVMTIDLKEAERQQLSLK
ncbi:MAG: PRC-barrel domain-containing protein [Anaerolineales bacterium]|nr:PRC-barrel domain-containing protein [Anaerolineae bacterium]MCA9973360.1 PRC-barrel domain-containing protein [Anaerolineales bacterium]